MDLSNSRVYRISPARVFHVTAHYNGWPNGLNFDRDALVFTADYKNGIMLLDSVSAAVTLFLEAVSTTTLG